jgi:hypothetical protein
MVFGFYLCGVGALYLAVVAVALFGGAVRQPLGEWRRHLLNYTRLTLGLAALALLLFVGLSVASGAMRFGGATSLQVPGDYWSAGALGWLALLAGALGLLSPLWALGRLQRPTATS